MIKYTTSPIAIIDLETTGSFEDKSPPKITQVGIVKWNGGNDIETYHSYVNPEVPLSDFIKSYTGITDEMLVDKPKFNGIANDVAAFCKGTVLAAWPAAFDVTILQMEYANAGYEKFPLDRRAIDLGTICRFIMESNGIPLNQPEKGYSLNSVADSVGIKICGTRHNAIDDAMFELDVFLRCLELNENKR